MGKRAGQGSLRSVEKTETPKFWPTHPSSLCQLLPKDKHLAQSQEAWTQGLALPLALLCDLWQAGPLSEQR